MGRDRKCKFFAVKIIDEPIFEIYAEFVSETASGKRWKSKKKYMLRYKLARNYEMETLKLNQFVSRVMSVTT